MELVDALRSMLGQSTASPAQKDDCAVDDPQMHMASTVSALENVVKFLGPIDGRSSRGNCPDTIILAPKTITKVVCICCDILTSFMMYLRGWVRDLRVD
jgi:hypothetical protein